MCASVCVCESVCVCTCDGVVCDELIQCYDFVIIFLGFSVYIFVDLVKRGVLIFVSEICRYKNDHDWYYCRNDTGCISVFITFFWFPFTLGVFLFSFLCPVDTKDRQLCTFINTR